MATTLRTTATTAIAASRHLPTPAVTDHPVAFRGAIGVATGRAC
jgi:hypothetical protein